MHYTVFDPASENKIISDTTVNKKMEPNKFMKPTSLYFCSHLLDRLEIEHEPHFDTKENSEFVPFRLHKRIAQGSYGSVYECTLCCSDFKMAAKVIPKKKTDLLYLNKEVAISRAVRHPGIVNFFDVIDFREHYLLLMEYVPGTDLFSWVQNQREHYGNGFLPVESYRERISLLKEILAIAEYLWTAKIVHRDWKLENILYCFENKKLKVCDFGLATYVLNQKKYLRQACGSVHYIPPEVMKKNYRGESATVWSLGVVIYVLLIGSYPFVGDKMDDICNLISKNQYRKQTISSHYNLPVGSGSRQDWLFADLMTKTFCLDPKYRLSLREMQEHPFFMMDTPPLIHCIQRRQVQNKRKKWKKPESQKSTTLPRSDSCPLQSPAVPETPRLETFNPGLRKHQDQLLTVVYAILKPKNPFFPSQATLEKMSTLVSVPGFPEWELYQNVWKNYTLNHIFLQQKLSPFRSICDTCYPSLRDWSIKTIPQQDKTKEILSKPNLVVSNEKDFFCLQNCLIQ